jgi:hypothetical protein
MNQNVEIKTVSKDYHMTTHYNYILIDVDEKKVHLHNGQRDGICFIDIPNIYDEGFEIFEITVEDIEDNIMSELQEYLIDDLIKEIIDYCDIENYLYNQCKCHPNYNIKGKNIIKLKYDHDGQYPFQNTHILLMDQPWIDKIYESIPSEKDRIIADGKCLNCKKFDREYNMNIKVSWAIKIPPKTNNKNDGYTFSIYTLKSWGSMLFTVINEKDELVSWHYDNSLKLQEGDSCTSIYLLEDKHLIISNYGDVSSVIFIEYTNYLDYNI